MRLRTALALFALGVTTSLGSGFALGQVIDGTPGNDNLPGTPDRDTGGGNDDGASGEMGNDNIEGGTGSDVLDGDGLDDDVADDTCAVDGGDTPTGLYSLCEHFD